MVKRGGFMRDSTKSGEHIFRDAVNQYLSRNLSGDNTPLDLVIRDFERQVISKALLVFNGNQRKVAAVLNMKYTTLNEKVKRLKLVYCKRSSLEIHLNHDEF